MPAISRRRPPLKRQGSSPSPSPTLSRRNADTRNLVTAQVFGGLEVGGVVRAILLGALVGGLVIFLFYPDISRLLEHWQNSSELSGLRDPLASEKDGARSDTKPRSINKEEQDKDRQSDGKSHEAAQDLTGKAIPKKTSTNMPEDSSEAYSCQQKESAGQSNRQRPPDAAKKPRLTKKEKVPKEDLMEEEEETEVEEEDSVEVELMEEEEPVEFIDLGSDEEDTISKSAPPNDKTNSGKDATSAEEKGPLAPTASQSHTPDVRDEEEPLVLTDGQPLSFTPVSPGDENFIRVGGKLKPENVANKKTANKPKINQNSSAKTDRKSSSAKTDRKSSSAKTDRKSSSAKTDRKSSSAQTDRKSSSSAQTNQNSSSSKLTPPNPSSGTATSKEASSPKCPQTKQDSGSKKKAPAKSSKNKESPEDADLPEEVRNFQSTFLKTVTAKKIFADGRRIPPLELLPQKETNSSVRVFLFNDFLSEAECDGLRRVHDKHVQEMPSNPLLCFDSLSTLRKHLSDVKHNVRVTPNDFVTGTKCLNASFSQQLGGWMAGNWSYSTAFYPGESRFSTIFAARVQHAMGLEAKNGGKFQITSYPTGKAYKAHTDCVLEGSDQRDRVATVLVYLDDVQDGGETKFPELGIWVKPRKGRALVWNNMSPEGVCEPHSLHVASKVNTGSKYILIRWYYYKSFYSLGKRPPEPSLPSRPPGTPRVSCDDYENGSCRWYDEWNNDHLLDYEHRKYTLI